MRISKICVKYAYLECKIWNPRKCVSWGLHRQKSFFPIVYCELSILRKNGKSTKTYSSHALTSHHLPNIGPNIKRQSVFYSRYLNQRTKNQRMIFLWSLERKKSFLQVANFQKASFVCYFIRKFEQKFYMSMTVLLRRIIFQILW